MECDVMELTKVLLSDTNDVGRDDVMKGLDVVVVEAKFTVLMNELHCEF